MKVLYSEHPLMFRNNPLGFILSVLLIVVGIGIIILLVWRIKTKASKLEVTERDVLHETGLLSKQRSEVSLASVRTVKVKQSFMDRIFGVGTVELYTAGDSPEIVVSGIPDPNKIREIIRDAQ